MEVIGYKNGQRIQRSEDDLNYLEIDITKDFVREYRYKESNSESRIEIDFTNPDSPEYKLINVSEEFRELFYKEFYTRKN